MSLLDPAERMARGVERQAALTAAPAPEPRTLYEESWRDYVFAEVWTRPGLDLRARFLIAICSAAHARDAVAVEGYARGALANAELTVLELREAALHAAVYSGWSTGRIIDAAVSAAVAALGLADARTDPIRAAPWDPAERHKEGQANFTAVMTFAGPPPQTAYFDGGINNFVFGEMWMRPGLDQRARRWVTMTGVADSSSTTPILSHTYAAMKSGNATREEMFEFVLQYAIHAGWPKASVMQTAVIEMAAKVEKGLPFSG